jgi:hypothetical protein
MIRPHDPDSLLFFRLRGEIPENEYGCFLRTTGIELNIENFLSCT